jgi:hypothetical protein
MVLRGGKVGVGTIVPTASLDVKPGAIASDNPNLRLQGTTATPPTGGQDGDIQVYDGSLGKRLYMKIGGAWGYISFN